MHWNLNTIFVNFQLISAENYVRFSLKNQRVSTHFSAFQRIQLISYIILAHSVHFLQKMRWNGADISTRVVQDLSCYVFRFSVFNSFKEFRNLNLNSFQIKEDFFLYKMSPSTLATIPKNVVFVLDRSGSTAGIKLEAIKVSQKTLRSVRYGWGVKWEKKHRSTSLIGLTMC